MLWHCGANIELACDLYRTVCGTKGGGFAIRRGHDAANSHTDSGQLAEIVFDVFFFNSGLSYIGSFYHLIEVICARALVRLGQLRSKAPRRGAHWTPGQQLNNCITVSIARLGFRV